ncbi:MAG: Hpt domain-containing protein [Spirochaetota bacterium]
MTEDITGFEKGPLLDMEGALSHVQGDREFLKEILKIFLDEIPGRLDEFRTALNEKNLQKVASAAHALKGVALTIGAVSCNKLSAAIEISARNDRFEEAASIFPFLERILFKLKETIEGLEH